MAWTYNPALITDADRVRFTLGDTLESDPLLSDEEITALLTSEGSVTAAALSAADTLALIFGRKVQSMTDDIGQRVDYGDRAARFRVLADRLRTSVTATEYPSSSSMSVPNRAVW